MTALIVGEHDNTILTPSSLHIVSAAQKVGGDIDLLIAGEGCLHIAQKACKIKGLRKVLLLDKPELGHHGAEAMGEAVVQIGKNYDYIMAPATTFGKNFLPRVAALLDVAQISDVIGIENKDTFVRPIYAGNAIVTLQSNDALKVMTVRPTAFPAVSVGSGTATLENASASFTTRSSVFVDRSAAKSERPELTAARVVVSGGRGFQNAEKFKMIEILADQLDAAIGASRAAVDAGYVSNDYQVGQTGKIVAPELYIAIGISGAIQHLAGMKDSKVIVAINKDPDAPIFQIADYSLVGDLFDIIPQLIQSLRELKP